MFLDYLSAAALIFFAEMGDKTQFLAMAFATKYPVKKILIGIAIGSFLNHGLAMILGKALLSLIEPQVINFVAGLMFVFFAFASLKVDDETLEENKSKYGPVFTVALAFFIGELGDKTQLAALGLALNSSALIFSLLGTVTGMILTSSVGIFVGLKLGRKIPEDKLKLSAFMMFLIFGIQKLYSSYLQYFNVAVLILLGFLLFSFAFLAYKKFSISYALTKETAFKRQAQALMRTKENIENKTIALCKGKETCDFCEGPICLVGHMKMLLNSNHGPVAEKEAKALGLLKNKNFEYKQARDLLKELCSYYDKYPKEYKNNLLFKEIRKSVEMIMFSDINTQSSYENYKKELKHLMK